LKQRIDIVNKKVVKRSWRVHAIFECQDCDWYCADYSYGPTAAIKHARENKHDVFGETGNAVRYLSSKRNMTNESKK